ncbi:protein OF MAMMALIAN LYST-INTERACTING PROTEIN 5 [Sesamum alatum]|uniref:Protein OF MAMMALIAN LYST-INTERACTING PROTEIN 5 n=1 Tax=Sesamum alatum TaxID=300844 RepID=A0AAE1Z1P4_9LAMI|nr:protein OF MAMMALIAN LYST-INTERACTING PROTEIN 5 [Sesamum alatum]
MATDNEPAKLLLPYLQRADELQKHEPLVAYYCRLYAMERGLKIPQSDRTKTTNALLVSLMNQLEKDKKSLKLGPDDYLHVEGFALNVFARADKQDRAGRADLNTAKTFYAASIFFEILNQFGELQPDLEQKQKYAAWKAADIRKALKEGRKPVPGPPGGDNDLPVPPSTSSGEYDLGPSRNHFAPQPDPTTVDPAARNAPDSASSPRAYDQENFQHSTNLSRQPSNVTPSPSSGISPPPHYPTDNYPPDNLHQPPSTNNPEHSISHQSYHHQPFQPEVQQHLPQHYPSHDVPAYSYPNFQSYPSFTESSLPPAPSNYPSFYQGPDASYANSPHSNTAAYPSTLQYSSSGRNGSVGSDAPYANSPHSNTAAYQTTQQYNSSSRNGSVAEVSPPTTQKYEYDSSYQPPPEKIAEAHKAARFAVGALAFDDVSVAVDFLKKSLELLTNPSAGN